VLAQAPAHQDSTGGKHHKGRTEDEHGQWTDEAGDFLGAGNDQLRDTADAHQRNGGNQEERTDNNPQDAQDAQMTLQASGLDRDVQTRDRPSACWADVEIGLKCGPAAVAEHTHPQVSSPTF
jgi:hypothetical protein